MLDFKVECIGGCYDTWQNLILSEKSENKIYLIVTLDSAKDCFEEWMVKYISQIVMFLKQVYRREQQEKTNIVIIVIGEKRAQIMEKAAQEAFWNAVRGIVHTAVIEEGSEQYCLNAVYAENGCEQSFKAIAKYLSAGTGEFSTGNTFDLRCWI